MPEQFEQFDFSKKEDQEKFGKLDKDKQNEIAQASEDEAYLMNNKTKELEKTVER